jgi:hypothetical protein
MKHLKRSGAALLLLALTGCASVLEGTSQTITLNTNPPGADCALTRQGTVIARVAPTPGSVVVEKTKHDITISCTKQGYQEATYLNHSGVEGATWGNIVLGGAVGWAIDSASGADNHYDSPVNMTMVPLPAPAVAQNGSAPGTEVAQPTAAAAWNVGGVDVCGQPWSMKVHATDGRLEGELWRASIKYDLHGLMSPQGMHRANAVKSQNGVPGPRFLKVDLDLSTTPAKGTIWVDGDGSNTCRSEFQFAAAGG